MYMKFGCSLGGELKAFEIQAVRNYSRGVETVVVIFKLRNFELAVGLEMVAMIGAAFCFE